MILEKTIIVKWCYQVKEHYTKLGYEYTGNGQPFEVPIEHLSSGSNVKITAKCDVCGKIKENLKYQAYIWNISKYGIYTCPTCSIFKNKLTNKERFGNEFPLQNKNIQEKSKQTLLEKYGVDNISKTDVFKEKYKNIMVEKYGVENYFQAEGFREKSKATNLKKYGSEYHTQTLEFKNSIRGENNNFWVDGRSYESKERPSEVKSWNKAVLKRDKYTCQCCNDNKGGNLIAHHLDGWNWAIDKRYEINNGITLCENCHIDFHTTFGFGDNTKSQYNDWITMKKSNDYPKRE